LAALAKALPPDIRKAARASKLSPLDYMLTVMNDESAEVLRRDRMAIAAAPFVHRRAGEIAPSKRELTQQAAEQAGKGSEWGDDLEPQRATLN
jgi:hypothetical protein